MYSSIMGALQVVRLSDHFGQYVVHLRCACGHTRECYAKTLAGFVGWDAKLADIVRRLRCSQCGKRSCTARVFERIVDRS